MLTNNNLLVKRHFASLFHEVTGLVGEAAAYVSAEFGGRKPEDGRIDWNDPAEKIHNLVRGVAPPYPGAFTTIAGKTVKILKTLRQPGRRGGFSVPTLFVENGFCFVQCADGGVLRIDGIELAGQRLQSREIDAMLGRTPLPLLS